MIQAHHYQKMSWQFQNYWIYGTPNADIHPNKGHDKIAKTLYKTYKDMQRDN